MTELRKWFDGNLSSNANVSSDSLISSLPSSPADVLMQFSIGSKVPEVIDLLALDSKGILGLSSSTTTRHLTLRRIRLSSSSLAISSPLDITAMNLFLVKLVLFLLQEIMTSIIDRNILVCLPTSNIVPQRLFGQHTRINHLPIPDLFLLRMFSLNMRSWSEEHNISRMLFCHSDWRSMILAWHGILQFQSFVILMVAPNLASSNKTISVRATLRQDLSPGDDSLLRVTNRFLSSLSLLNRDNNEPQMWIEVFKPVDMG